MFNKLLSLLFISLVLVFTSCQNNSQNQAIESKKSAFTSIIQILNGGNIDELGNYLAENIIEHEPNPTMTNKAGLEAVKEMFRYYHKVLPDMKTTIHSMAVSGDTLFAHLSSSATTAEPFMGMPANSPVKMNFVDVVRFEGDKVAEHWNFISMEEMMSMMPKQDMPDESKMKKGM